MNSNKKEAQQVEESRTFSEENHNPQEQAFFVDNSPEFKAAQRRQQSIENSPEVTESLKYQEAIHQNELEQSPSYTKPPEKDPIPKENEGKFLYFGSKWSEWSIKHQKKNKQADPSTPFVENELWTAFHVQDIFEVEQNLVQSIEATGVQPEVIYLQHHSFPGKLSISDLKSNESYDMINSITGLTITPALIKEYRLAMEEYISIQEYLTTLENAAMEVEDITKIDVFFEKIRLMESIHSLKFILQQVDEGGTFIFGGCSLGKDDEGKAMLEELYQLSNKNITIYANQDYTIGASSKGRGSFLETNIGGIERLYDMGWIKILPNLSNATGYEIIETKNDLMLCASGLEAYGEVEGILKK